jgi:hypothetical protein
MVPVTGSDESAHRDHDPPIPNPRGEDGLVWLAGIVIVTGIVLGLLSLLIFP